MKDSETPKCTSIFNFFENEKLISHRTLHPVLLSQNIQQQTTLKINHLTPKPPQQANISPRSKISKFTSTDTYTVELSHDFNPSVFSSVSKPKKQRAKSQKATPENPEKPRLLKEEREKHKRIVAIGTEDGVRYSNRQMSKKEKKCLSKGKKKMEMLVKKEKMNGENDEEKNDDEKNDDKKNDEEKNDEEKNDEEKNDEEKNDDENNDEENNNYDEKNDEEKNDEEKNDEEKNDEEKNDEEKNDDENNDEEKTDSEEEYEVERKGEEDLKSEHGTA